jgi:hypothetical protein
VAMHGFSSVSEMKARVEKEEESERAIEENLERMELYVKRMLELFGIRWGAIYRCDHFHL